MDSSLTEISSNKCFGGMQKVYSHMSKETQCVMKFGIFLPPAVLADIPKKVPVLYYLSGLTCNQDNFVQKSGFQRSAAEHELVVVNPDTSPRGCNIDGEDESYDFGSGAGFYVDAAEPKWSTHYRMYSYVTIELPKLIEENFPVIAGKSGITGHSMGGHGALMIALRNPGKYLSASAFAPIVNPIGCPWGQKALGGYLGPDQTQWTKYDSCALAKGYTGPPLPILIDQGGADQFLENQLFPDRFQEACVGRDSLSVNLRMQEGYDHSYFFISTFMEDHIRHHASCLKK